VNTPFASHSGALQIQRRFHAPTEPHGHLYRLPHGAKFQSKNESRYRRKNSGKGCPCPGSVKSVRLTFSSYSVMTAPMISNHRFRLAAVPASLGVALLLAFGSVTTPKALAEIPGLDALGGLVSEQFDKDSNDKISSTEWQAGIADGFDEMDTDGNGGLTSAELDQLADPIRDEFGDLGAMLVSALIKSVVLAFDTDKNQVVGRSEYTAGAKKVFSGLDSNGDDSVTEAELKKLPTILTNSVK